MTLSLAQTARYVDTKGHEKVALVVGTPESVAEGTDLQTLNPGHYIVTVFSPSGRTYTKHSVPDATHAEFNGADYTNEDGLLVGVLFPTN